MNESAAAIGEDDDGYPTVKESNMTSIVISEVHGGFGISAAAAELMGLDPAKPVHDYDRSAPELVAAVRELGADASGRYANLQIVEVPDDAKWHIHEYDGFETIHEDHRSWGSGGLETNC